MSLLEDLSSCDAIRFVELAMYYGKVVQCKDCFEDITAYQSLIISMLNTEYA